MAKKKKNTGKRGGPKRKAKKNARKESEPRSLRIMAWIYAVINPVIEALRIEVRQLGKKRWHWNAIQKRLEYVHPLSRYVRPGQEPNLEDFTHVYRKDIGEQFTKHDKLVEGLGESVQRLFDEVHAAPEFSTAFERAAQEYTDEKGDDAAFGAFEFGVESAKKFVVQYVINDEDRIPDGYAEADFWNRYRTRFRDVVRLERLQKLGKAAKKESRALTSLSDEVVSRLMHMRSDLCEQFDIPPAPPDWIPDEVTKILYGLNLQG